MKSVTVVTVAIFIRVLVALCTRTFFQPDEYFQSLEPAHHLVFGYGHLTWEWTSERPLRSFLYPALNVPVYWALKVMGIDDALGGWLLIAAPRVLHGALGAITDIWVCELTRVVLGERYVATVLFVSITSFFHALSLSRSLSNSLETSLTTVAFSYYPWNVTDFQSLRTRVRKALVFSALACAVRPTNAVIGSYLYVRLLWRLRRHRHFLSMVILDILAIGLLTFFSIFALDSLYFRKPTFTPLNFLRTNLSSVSLFYGANSWHYYITQAFPILCTTALPFVVHGAWIALTQCDGRLTLMLECVAWTIGIYSFAGHKEWRFIHPLLPLLHVLAAKSLVDLNRNIEIKPKSSIKVKIMRKNKVKPKSIFAGVRRCIPPIRRSHLAVLLFSLPASISVVVFYCRAPISVMAYLRQLPVEELRESVGFLMPCHSTPWQAYLHHPELAFVNRLWALGCEPPLASPNPTTTYHDQATLFYKSPLSYIERHFPARVDPLFPPSPFPMSIPGVVQGEQGDIWEHTWPRHLVLFGSLLEEQGVRSLLDDKGYREVWRAGQDWEGDGKRRGGVRVWRYVSKAQASDHV